MSVHQLPARAQFVSITRDQRRRIEALVEELVSMLDMIDGNDDLEDDGTSEADDLELSGDESEPSLGWTDRWDQSGPHYHVAGADDDREAETVFVRNGF